MEELDGFLQLMWMKKERSKPQMLLVWLPLNQEPSSIYCSQRKLLSLSRKITQGKKKQKTKTFFVVVLLDTHFSASVFTLFIFNYASAFVFAGCPV